MGNHPSSGSNHNHNNQHSRSTRNVYSIGFRRPIGRLGLSRAELDNRCKPSGLYESCAWEDKAIRKVIADGKIAARLQGSDQRSTATDQECPICFLHYKEINMLQCCKATICTECYLQIQDPHSMDSPCPFCNHPKMVVKVAKTLDEKDVQVREEEEQKVIEATIKARLQSGTMSSSSFGSSVGGDDDNSRGSSTAIHIPQSDGNTNNQDNIQQTSSSFGSTLDEHLRSRTRTLSSDITNNNNNDGTQIVAMSPQERNRLEEQMMSQRNHPLMRQMRVDAEQESQRHIMEHFERRGGRNGGDGSRGEEQGSRYTSDEIDNLLARASRVHSRASRIQASRRARMDSDRAIQMFTGISPDDDDDDDESLFVLGGEDIADEDGNSGGGGGGSHHRTGRRLNRRPSLDELFMLEAAMYLSLRDEATSSSPFRRFRRHRSGQSRNANDYGRSRNENENENDNENENSNQQNNDDNSNGDGGNNDENEDNNDNPFSALLDRRGNRTSHPRRESPVFMDRMDNLYAAHMSEERQLELAIQLSLREAQERESSQQQESENEDQSQTTAPVPAPEQPQEQNENQDQNQDDGQNLNQDQAQDQSQDHGSVRDQNENQTEQEQESAPNHARSNDDNDNNIFINNGADHGEEEVVFDWSDNEEDTPSAAADGATDTLTNTDNIGETEAASSTEPNVNQVSNN